MCQLIIFVLVYRTTSSRIREASHHFVLPMSAAKQQETGNHVSVPWNFERAIVSIRSPKRTIRCRERLPRQLSHPAPTAPDLDPAGRRRILDGPQRVQFPKKQPSEPPGIGCEGGSAND
jgi:hypothetical protein